MKRPCDQAGDSERGNPSCGENCSPASARSRCRRRYAHRVSANRLGDVLDAMAAERTVIEIELVPDLVVDGVRNANCARPGERLETGGDVDAIAENIVAVDDDISEIDADPQL